MAVAGFLAGSEPANPYLQTLISGRLWTGTINVAFAEGPIRSGGRSGTGDPWFDYERAAFYSVMASYEAVANIDYSVTGDYSRANVLWYSVGPGVIGADSLAAHMYPGMGPRGQDFGYFRWDVNEWNYLQQGGAGYSIILHELGHGLGLEHPHSDDAVTPTHVPFPGVMNAGSLGTTALNQGIWTAMSYNDGWDRAGGASTYDTGYAFTPMAFDIAALQAMYGPNTTYRTGNDYYYIGSLNGWACIWDAGGIDTIIADGEDERVLIDLRAATLAPGDVNAGGYVSYFFEPAGIGRNVLHPVGYTIANGVVIENAIGGNHDDNLTGNHVANTLEGRRGNDYLDGLDGHDTLIGADGTDTLKGGGGHDNLNGGAGADRLDGGDGYDSAYYDTFFYGQIQVINMMDPVGSTLDAAGDTFVSVERVYGSPGEDWIRGTDGNESLNGRDGSDRLTGRMGSDVLDGGNGIDLVEYWSPVVSDMLFSYLNTGEAAGDQFISIEGLRGSSGADDLRGDGYDNPLQGGEGADVITGRGGNDTLHGGLDRDTLYGNEGMDSLDGGIGLDTLVGGVGDDFYILDEDDIVIEYANEGYDTIGLLFVPNRPDWSREYTLAENANVERIEADGEGVINITGNSQANDIVGNFGANRILGMGGNDTLNGWVGSDYLDGGIGDDTIMVTHRAGNDTYVGGDGIDALAFYYDFDAGFTFDLALGSQGFGHYRPGVGWLTTGSITYSGFENVTAGAGDDTIYGTSGNNALIGNTGHDTLDGRDGNDTLNGGAGFDSMIGGIGDDRLVGAYEYSVYGVDFMDGGADIDTADFATHGYALWIDLTYAGREVWTMDRADLAGGTWRQVADLVGIENLVGSSGSDMMWGDTAANRIEGRAGADLLDGRAGDDIVEGGLGFDTMNGGAGNDRLVGTYEYSVYGVDVMNGGADVDTADFATHGHALWIDLMYAGREAWTMDRANLSGGAWRQVADLVAVENVIGSAGADQLWGDNGANRIEGRDGADVIDGRGGIDVVDGGNGDDVLVGTYEYRTNGIDVMNGGAGTDTADFSAHGHALWIDLFYGPEVWTMDRVDVTWGTWRQVADLNAVENLIGTAGHDMLWGDHGANRIEGRAGNDYIDGRDGQDTIIGGAGGDRLLGGGDGDRFLYANAGEAGDFIVDFAVGLDQIVLSRAGFGLAGSGNLAQAGVRFVAGTVATGVGPAVVFDNAADAIYFDQDGVGGAAQILLATLQLPSQAILQASDFLIV